MNTTTEKNVPHSMTEELMKIPSVLFVEKKQNAAVVRLSEIKYNSLKSIPSITKKY